ncbi:MAG: RRXRR domain-containing protein [Crocosphaera sp.]
MQNSVFVLDTTKKPLNPVNSGQARRLLKQGKAAVFRRYPFTIILNDSLCSVYLWTSIPKCLSPGVSPGVYTARLPLKFRLYSPTVRCVRLTYNGSPLEV